ncbi:MAG: hypothetical protein ACSHYA_14655 [Opitutaceae bacterium]
MNNDTSNHSGWKKHRLAQHLEFKALTFSQKLERIEDMADFAREVLEERKRKGFPYLDPISGERIPRVAEDKHPYPKTEKDP